jgi:hypothetical protein
MSHPGCSQVKRETLLESQCQQRATQETVIPAVVAVAAVVAAASASALVPVQVNVVMHWHYSDN